MRIVTKFKSSLLYKYIASFTIPIAIISLLFSIVLFAVSYRIIDNFVIKQFESTLEITSTTIFEDIEKNDVKAADNGSPDKYKKLLDQLNATVKKYDVENAYILSKANGKEHIVALSNTDNHQQDYVFSEEMHEAVASGNTQTSDIYKDEYGIHKSIFIPFKDTDIIFGLDMDASFISKLQTETLWICIILTIVFVIFGIIVAYFISVGITKPIKKMTRYVGQVAQGDLAVEPLHIKGSNEIAQLSSGIENMTEDLRSLIKQIAQNAEQVAAMSEELTASSEQTSASIQQITSSMQEVAAGSEKQTSSIEEVDSHITTISNKMSEVVTSVTDVTDKAFQASAISEKGNTTIQDATEKMAVTSQAIQESAAVVERLSTYTNEIGDIVTLITQITDQTNLLALNASIEAARAGEHGKGFAVVAEEVRKLADQSLEATNSIRTRIETIKEESAQAVKSMAISSSNLAESSTTFNASGEAFAEIYTQVTALTREMDHVNNVMSNINEGVSSIASSVEQVGVVAVQASGNIQNVAAASEEQSASIEEITASSNNLAEMAQQLRNIIQKFQL
ncbi:MULTISPECIES: methyl-accepting chemotaxis protein [Lysinibacillus]|uniref:methyl-accepting chemotaxis protein n=1 Tax=Lysinibacillus TaxID=400634 RepID=UPI0021528131|nr:MULTISPECIES: methyl-accepting chemotaxis protein [Lysinibacillus]MCR6521467.1 methyl-accepting chemotaxis protein [Lysinibacillus capsici]MEC1302935.1 methyl-accepting chemotaxis protein [Lysinibacillus capsici]MED3875252.1 methyl-accepting chemotaxis protein [Lysinibacillus capsici]MED4552123.1 methyl-accepting chemotaxis protein [Lysinibacillus capsici]WBF54372.1 HAMP domain-containing protein [Lysinibacillus sp. JK80]